MQYPTSTQPKKEPTLKEPIQQLFVYGTLRKGNGNDALLIRGGSEFVKEVWLYGHAMYGMLSVFPADHEDRVRGELWEVPTKTLLGPIDRLESHPHGWIRTWVSDQHNGIWIYIDAFIKDERLKIIDGDINNENAWINNHYFDNNDYYRLW